MEDEVPLAPWFQDNPLVMLLIDPESGTVAEGNRAAVRLFGGTLRPLRGRSAWELVTADPAQVLRDLARARDGECQNWQVRVRRPPDEDREMEVFTGPLRLGGRTLVQVVLCDVTERTRFRWAFRRQRDLTSILIDQAPVLVVLLDLQGRIVRFNRAAEVLSGWSRAEVLGRRIVEFLVSPEQAEGVGASIAEAFRDRVTTHHTNHWITRDGSRRLHTS